jgi:hypothetical protein
VHTYGYWPENGKATYHFVDGLHAELVLDELLRGGELLALFEPKILEDGPERGPTLWLPHHLYRNTDYFNLLLIYFCGEGELLVPA